MNHRVRFGGLLAGLLVLSSCTEKEAPVRVSENETVPPQEEVRKAQTASVEMRISSIGKRIANQTSSDIAAEDAINTLDIFVFNSSGTLEKLTSVSVAADDALSPDPVTIEVTPGLKYVYVYANYPSSQRSLMSTWTSKASHPYMSNNIGTNSFENKNFVMRWNGTVTPAAGANTALDVVLRRAVSRVRLVSLRNSLANSSSLTVRGIFIRDAVVMDGTAFDDSSDAEQYTNRWGTTHPSALSFIDLDEADPIYNITAWKHSFTVANGVTWQAEYDGGVTQSGCYAYPNSVSTAPTAVLTLPESWTSRCSAMVIVAEVGGETVYYPYNLPAMTDNTSYDLTVTINKIGSDRPDGPWGYGNMTGTVVTTDWETGATYSENF